MPGPVSATEKSTSPRSSSISTPSVMLPSEVNLPALVSRLIRICERRWASVVSMNDPTGHAKRPSTPLCRVWAVVIITCWQICTMSSEA